MSTKVFIVDDHPMVVAGLHSLLTQLENLEVAGSVSNAFEAIPFLKQHKVDVSLLDINLPDISGIDLCKKIHAEFPLIKIIGISTFSDRSYIGTLGPTHQSYRDVMSLVQRAGQELEEVLYA